MAGLFAVAGGPDGMAALDRIMGPSYDYAGHIKSPTEMGMSAEGDFGVLADDVSGLLGYVTMLIGGDCSRGIGTCASKKVNNADGSFAGEYGKPLGNQFFLDTPVKCKDIATNQDVTRSIYVNNIPDGRIPMVSDMTGVSFDDFKGLMPGIMSNVAQINPMQILMAFVTGTSTACQMVTMPTMDVNDRAGTDRRYITNGDIKAMPDSWFSGGVPGKSSYNTAEPEDFQTMSSANAQPATSANLESSPLKGSKIDYSKMPNDIVIKFYYSMLGLLGLYMLLRLMIRKKK
jgi:hypothetical protein